MDLEVGLGLEVGPGLEVGRGLEVARRLQQVQAVITPRAPRAILEMQGLR